MCNYINKTAAFKRNSSPLLFITNLQIYFCSYSDKNNELFSAGPIFLPIIGSLYAISATTVYKSQEKWRKQYGNIVGHKVGNYLVVFVRGFDELKNGLKHPYFQDRSKSIQFTQRTMYKPLGKYINPAAVSRLLI